VIARLAFVIAIGCIAGCADHPHLFLFREDFESSCNGAPCGWTQIAGAAGSASYVETLPSEHGVQLVGPGVAIARDVASAPASPTGEGVAIDDDLRAHIVARCDPGATLSLIVTLDAGTRSIDVSGGATFPPTWDGTRAIFVLSPPQPTDVGVTFTRVRHVVIHKQGTGACEVDYLSLADSALPFIE
jgi:hypothetical protein